MEIKKKTVYFLAAFVFVGLVLRLIYPNTITFFYDQARDAFASLNIILNKDIKIIGPSTDIPGLFHGPLYWYMLSPIYYLFKGNVVAARVFLILISLLNIPVVYLLAKKIFKKNEIALLGALFFAVSFEAVQYSRWLSNPSPAVLTINLTFLGLWLFLSGQIIGFPLTLLGWSLSIHFQFFLVYQLVFIIPVVALAIHKNKYRLKDLFNKKNIILFLVTFLILSPFAAAQIKFKFMGIRSLIAFLLSGKSGQTPLIVKLDKYIKYLLLNVKNNVVSVEHLWLQIIMIFGVIALIFLFFKHKKDRLGIFFLTIWFFSPIFVYLIEGTTAYFLNIGNSTPLIILCSYLIFSLYRKNFLSKGLVLLVVGAILVSNVFLIIKENKSGETLFTVQSRIILPREKEVVEWIYRKSKNEPFAIDCVTNPLFINATWSYLFSWYGKSKYHYLPSWLGYPQDDYPGGKILSQEISAKDKLLFLIIEPDDVIPKEYLKAYEMFENTRSDLIEVKKFDNFTVEKRKITKLKNFSRDELTNFVLH